MRLWRIARKARDAMVAARKRCQISNHPVVCCILDMVICCVRTGAEMHSNAGGAREQSPAIIV